MGSSFEGLSRQHELLLPHEMNRRLLRLALPEIALHRVPAMPNRAIELRLGDDQLAALKQKKPNR